MVTVFYLLVAGLLVFIGIRRLKGLTGMRAHHPHPEEPAGRAATTAGGCTSGTHEQVKP